MIKKNINKIFSISGFSFITKIHDGNFATINMNNILKIYSGIKPFNCLNQIKNISKGIEIYNLKEIFISDNINLQNEKIYLILYERNIIIYCFENNYKKTVLLQKIKNELFIESFIQLNNKNIIFFDKENKIKLLQYQNDIKNIFINKIQNLKVESKEKYGFIFSFIEFKDNHLITTSSNKHPYGENIIRVFEIKVNSNNLINYQNFEGYSCSTFENNICKLVNQKTICIAINFYIKKNTIINRNAIVLLNYEFLEITTIIEMEFQINTIFNFSGFSKKENYKNIYEYIIISQLKADNNNTKIKKKGKDNYRFIDFFIFEPKNEYEPLLMEEKRIATNNPIDITNSFLLNNKNLVIFQTSQINIYEIF